MKMIRFTVPPAGALMAPSHVGAWQMVSELPQHAEYKHGVSK